MLNKNILNGKNELANYVLNELNITEETYILMVVVFMGHLIKIQIRTIL
jgi:hypothetical protein